MTRGLGTNEPSGASFIRLNPLPKHTRCNTCGAGKDKAHPWDSNDCAAELARRCLISKNANTKAKEGFAGGVSG